MTLQAQCEAKAFDEELHAHELQAREKLRLALEDMPTGASDAFNRVLESRIVPSLGRVGFDEQLCWLLFRMSSASWKSLEPFGDGVEPMNPALVKDLGEVRKGVLSKSEQNARVQSVLHGMTPRAKYVVLEEAMRPANLLGAIDDVSLSWIVLPRAYDLLERTHACHLLFYARALDRETDSEFIKALARVVIEFVGNYSVKYIDDVRLRRQTVEALFYGYSAMFWMNLRNSPPGLEDGLVFESFLRWTKSIHQRFAADNEEMGIAIKRMEAEKDAVFPPRDAFGITHSDQHDVRKFLVALRHGAPGVQSVVGTFGVGPLLESQTYGRLPFASVPKTLNVLLGEVKSRYSFESPATRASIREMLGKLAASYESDRLGSALTASGFSDVLRFVGPRISRMIQSLAASLQGTVATLGR